MAEEAESDDDDELNETVNKITANDLAEAQRQSNAGTSKAGETDNEGEKLMGAPVSGSDKDHHSLI